VQQPGRKNVRRGIVVARSNESKSKSPIG